MFTSCCPAWVKYLENENPKYLKHISTCKSPMQMFASILKDRYAEKDKEDGRTTFHIAVMPCTAKKMEAARPEFRLPDGTLAVDLVLTTKEIIKMVQESGIHLTELEYESPDLPFGLGSGAGTIYGTTGGVAEAVVRFCLPDKSKNVLRELKYSPSGTTRPSVWPSSGWGTGTCTWLSSTAWPTPRSCSRRSRRATPTSTWWRS